MDGLVEWEMGWKDGMIDGVISCNDVPRLLLLRV